MDAMQQLTAAQAAAHEIEEQARAKAGRILDEARQKAASAATAAAKADADPGTVAPALDTPCVVDAAVQPAYAEEAPPVTTPSTPVSSAHDVRHGIRALEWKAAMRKEDESERAAGVSPELARPSGFAETLAIRAKHGSGELPAALVLCSQKLLSHFASILTNFYHFLLLCLRSNSPPAPLSAGSWRHPWYCREELLSKAGHHHLAGRRCCSCFRRRCQPHHYRARRVG